jgi:hypothetical protein
MLLKTLNRPSRLAVTLQASTTVTASGNGSSVWLSNANNGVHCIADFTAVDTDITDILDLFVQTKVDGTNWVDVFRFKRHTGATVLVPARWTGKITANLTLEPGVAEAEFENGTALVQSTSRNIMGDEWRARWAVTSGNDPSFTFAVNVIPF